MAAEPYRGWRIDTARADRFYFECDMLEKRKLDNGDEIWRNEGSELRVSVPAPTVVLLTVKGHMSVEMLPLVTGEPERRCLRGIRIDWYGDYSEMTGYDSQARIALSDFLNKYKDRMNSVAILVRYKIVAMGVAVANLAVGGKIEAYSNREKFDAALTQAVARGSVREQRAAR